MSVAPINLFVNVPTENDERWKNVGRDLHSEIWPVTIKAFYLIGLLLSIFKSTEILAKASRNEIPGTRIVSRNFSRYFTAFAVCSSGVELLGRSIRGIVDADRESARCLTVGFNWLANPNDIREGRDLTVLTTSRMPYTARDLINLRNFTAHGQAVSSRNEPFLDFELLAKFPEMIGRGIETWWFEITTRNEFLCQSLAQAALLPVHQSQPIVTTAFNFSAQAAGNPFFKLDFS